MLVKTKPKLRRDTARALSWSAISSFEYDPEQWYRSYILGIKSSSREMTFGSKVDKRIQEDPKFLPDLPRYPLMQYKLVAVFDGIPLIGLPDGLTLTDKGGKCLLADYKTGKKAWDQKRADETGQLTMYLFLLYLTQKLSPTRFDCMIHWLETRDNEDFSIGFVKDMEVKTFHTKRTMVDILKFGQRIKDTVKAMDKYCENHK